MKKNIFLLMAALMSVLTFSSCSDDDNDAVGTMNPEQEVAGTYAGSWHQVLTNSAGEVISEKNADGTIVVSAGEQWIVNLTLNVAAPVITKETSEVANCSGNSANGYFMVNTKGANLKNFSARQNEGALTLVYVTQVKEGRKTFDATNTFKGVLQTSAPQQ